MLKEGTKAPAFKLPGADGDVSLADYAGRVVVLYFYPRDSTPGCTVEAQDFQKALPALRKLGADVLGVSRDSLESHGKFAGKCGLKFPLLTDAEAKVHEKYGAWGEKTLYGKKSIGCIRTTVIIGKDGKVARVFSPVKVPGHVDKVIAAIKELEKA